MWLLAEAEDGNALEFWEREKERALMVLKFRIKLIGYAVEQMRYRNNRD